MAVERVQEISDYIAYDNPSAAAKWIDSVFDKVDPVKNNPEMGRIVPEIGVPSIREIVFSNYRIQNSVSPHAEVGRSPDRAQF